MTTYVPHDGENLPRAERCDCKSPDIKAIWGLGYGPNNIITVYCEECGHDFLSIWPQGSLHEDGWPKDWTRPPESDLLADFGPGCFSHLERAKADPDIGRCDLCGTEEGERRRITLASGLTAWACRLCKGTADQHAHDLAESHMAEMDDRG